MATDWFYYIGDQRIGPVGSQRLKDLAKAGELQPDNLVWKEGMSKPQAASKVKGLFEPPSIPPAPPVEETQPPIDSDAEAGDLAAKDGSVLAELGHAIRQDLALNVRRAANFSERFMATAKTAARLAAKHAERTKLLKVTLPIAYAALGKAIYADGRYRSDFADQYQQLDRLRQEQAALRNHGPSQRPEGIAAQAKAAASAAKDAAHAKAIEVRIRSALGGLGEAVYQRYGNDDHYTAMTRPIASALSQASTLEQEIGVLSQPQQGKLVTPKRLLLATLCLLVCCVALAGNRLFFSGGSVGRQATVSTEEGRFVGSGDESSQSTPDAPPRRDYSKGPNGEIPRPFTTYLLSKGGFPVDSLDGKAGITIQGHKIDGSQEMPLLITGKRFGVMTESQSPATGFKSMTAEPYHGKITWTNEIGPEDMKDMSGNWLYEEFAFVRGKGEMYFWGGVPEGTLRLWHENGKKWLELPYVDGKRHGLALAWYDNGQEGFQLRFVADKRQGPLTTYWPNGRKQEEGSFKDDKKDGLWTKWDSDGNELSEGHYVRGKRTVPAPAPNSRHLVGSVAQGSINGVYDTTCNAIKSVECYATKGTLVIDLTVDPSSWEARGTALHLIVRLFDENGQYLTHFTTKEKFTTETRAFSFVPNGVLLEEGCNRLEYPINVRDLRVTAGVEVGFKTWSAER